jgi:hypothetical protein
MSLFSRKAPEPEPAPKGGGLAVLRGRARAHARTPQGASWLREAVHLSSEGLEAFLAGGDLAMPKVGLLISYLEMRATYDPETDLLKSTAPEPTSMGVAPLDDLAFVALMRRPAEGADEKASEAMKKELRTRLKARQAANEG